MGEEESGSVGGRGGGWECWWERRRVGVLVKREFIALLLSHGATLTGRNLHSSCAHQDPLIAEV